MDQRNSANDPLILKRLSLADRVSARSATDGEIPVSAITQSDHRRALANLIYRSSSFDLDKRLSRENDDQGHFGRQQREEQLHQMYPALRRNRFMCLTVFDRSLKEYCAAILTRIIDYSELVRTIRFLRRSLSTSIVLTASIMNAQELKALPPWTPGYLYIHHISTGRGNATYIVMPDGTTMLIDAGEADQEFIESVAPLKPYPAKPNAKHSAGYSIAQYIRRFAPSGSPATLDFALITHFHTDHIGTLLPSSPVSSTGAYRLAGITEVADLINIKTLVDRAAPDYNSPVNLRACDQGNEGRSLQNYLNMAEYRMRTSQTVLGLHAGELDQIRMRHMQEYPDFHIRNIASSGVIWTGREGKVQQYIPRDAVKDCHYDENPFSNVLKISYGKFSYYTGGDIPGVPDYTQPFWRDVETPVSAVVGPVDVMTLDHHGNRDSTNGAILRALRPRVIIQQNWLSAQPGEEVVVRMASKEYYPGPRDVFSTGMSPETRVAIGPIMDRIYRSYRGHVVLRVAPGGSTYEVFVLNDDDDVSGAISHFGPYEAK